MDVASQLSLFTVLCQAMCLQLFINSAISHSANEVCHAETHVELTHGWHSWYK